MRSRLSLNKEASLVPPGSTEHLPFQTESGSLAKFSAFIFDIVDTKRRRRITKCCYYHFAVVGGQQ